MRSLHSHEPHPDRSGRPDSDALRPLDLARHSGVSVETLRYFERLGLLEEPPRSPGGHRRYPPETLERMQLIKSIRRLGYDLPEVAELFAGVRVDHHVDDQDDARTENALHDVDSRIASSEKIRAALTAEPSDHDTTLAGDRPDVPLLALIEGGKNRYHELTDRSGSKTSRLSLDVRVLPLSCSIRP